MSRMIRKQIYIEPMQDALLKRRARELGMSEAQLIRRCLDELERQAVTPPMDRQAWQDELSFIQRRAQAVTGRQERRSWTREELYAERIERVFP